MGTRYEYAVAFDEQLGERVRQALGFRSELSERRMFGGLAFMVDGKMACGVMGDELMVRMPPAEVDEALLEPGTRRFDFTGRPMKGFVVVAAGRLADEADLVRWVDAGADYAASLPAKKR